jgi:hypothetical protein
MSGHVNCLNPIFAGVRICSRLLEKRPDFRNFVYTMGKERWLQMTSRLKEFLETVVRRVSFGKITII